MEKTTKVEGYPSPPQSLAAVEQKRKRSQKRSLPKRGRACPPSPLVNSRRPPRGVVSRGANGDLRVEILDSPCVRSF